MRWPYAPWLAQEDRAPYRVPSSPSPLPEGKGSGHGLGPPDHGSSIGVFLCAHGLWSLQGPRPWASCVGHAPSQCVLDGRAYGALHPRVWGPKRAGGRPEMATGAVGPGTCISPAWSADPLLRKVGLLGRSSAALSLSTCAPGRPCPFGLPSSSRSFGVAVVAALPVAALPARLSLWDILLPLLRSGRSALCAHPAVPMGHPPPSPLGWPYTRPCPTGYVLLPRCAQAVARPCPTGYVLLPRCAQAVSSLVVPPVPQVKVKHNGGSRHPWAEVRSGRGKRGASVLRRNSVLTLRATCSSNPLLKVK